MSKKISTAGKWSPGWNDRLAWLSAKSNDLGDLLFAETGTYIRLTYAHCDIRIKQPFKTV